jgi:hypothetical protein
LSSFNAWGGREMTPVTRIYIILKNAISPREIKLLSYKKYSILPYGCFFMAQVLKPKMA